MCKTRPTSNCEETTTQPPSNMHLRPLLCFSTRASCGIVCRPGPSKSHRETSSLKHCPNTELHISKHPLPTNAMTHMPHMRLRNIKYDISSAWLLSLCHSQLEGIVNRALKTKNTYSASLKHLSNIYQIYHVVRKANSLAPPPPPRSPFWNSLLGMWTQHDDTTIYNHIQPYTTIYNHIQPYTTIYNHIQPYTTIYNHIQQC